MHNIIIGTIQLFDKKQNIQVFKKENEEPMNFKIETDDLPISLINLCYMNDIYDIHLFGNEGYLAQITNGILQQEKFTYNKNLIKIGVN